MTYSEMKSQLDEVAVLNSKHRNALVSARDNILMTVSGLTSMQFTYADLITEIDTALAANPNDLAYEVLAAEKGKLVTDFLALKAYAQDLQAAFDGVAE